MEPRPRYGGVGHVLFYTPLGRGCGSGLGLTLPSYFLVPHPPGGTIMGGSMGSLRVTGTCVLCFSLIAAGAFSQQSVASRTPVPSASEQDTAMATARTLFKAEYAQANTPDAKRTLAKKILEQADVVKGNPASHFVLLRLARDIAVQAGDLDLAVQAIDAITQAFDIDGVKMKAEVLAQLSGGKQPAPSTSPKPSGGEGNATSAIEQASKEQEEAAAKVHQPVRIINSVGMQLILIPAGDFWMGSTPEQIAWVAEENNRRAVGPKNWMPNEGPRHKVRISNVFYMGVYEVTQAEYEQVMFHDPGRVDNEQSKSASEAGKDGDRNPARMISWEDAVQFCKKLSSLPKEKTARRTYRLPTEAEFEYACRAGSTTMWCFGDDPGQLDEYAWTKENGGGRVHPVGQKKPNTWGLYDMYGNAWEWCNDHCDRYSYRESPEVDPQGAASGSRVMRGGSCIMGALACRSGFRDTPMPDNFRKFDLGLRVVCEVPGRSKSGKARTGTGH